MREKGEPQPAADHPPEKTRRRLLAATACLVGAGGAAALYPLLESLGPVASGSVSATLEVDIATLASGRMLVLNWAGKPLWILRRTPEMLSRLEEVSARLTDPDSRQPQQPAACANPERSLRPDIAVLLGECTHLGCVPVPRLQAGTGEGMPSDWPGGFVCPCHGAHFDLAGRVFRDGVATRNLLVPPYVYLSETRLLVGVDSKPHESGLAG